MNDNSVKVSGGILLVRSKSGTSRVQKVLVYSKRGKKKNQVKCRLKKYVKEKKASKIPVWVKTYRRTFKNIKKKKSSQASIKCDSKKTQVLSKDFLQGDDFKKSKKCKVCTLPSSVISKKMIEAEDEDYLSNKIEEPPDEKETKMEEEISSEVTSLPENTSKTLSDNKGESVDSGTLHLHCSGNKIQNEKYKTNSEAQSLSHSENSNDEELEYEPLHSWQKIAKHLANDDIDSKSSVFECAGPAKISKFEESKSTSIIFLNREESPQSNIDYDEKSSSISIEKKGTEEENDGDDPVEDVEDKTKPHLPFKNTNIFISSKPTIVMAQYQTIKTEQKGEFPGSENEVDDDDVSETGSEELRLKYILSGLRPLRSEESRLYIDSEIFQNKKKTEPKGTDVKPLLQDIPSEVFQKRKKKPKKKKTIQDIKKPSEKETSSEETKSSPTEPTDTSDSGPVKQLKEYEDKIYTIETGITDVKKDDFCLHTKDIPEGDLAAYSSVDMKEVKKGDFCHHVNDIPEGELSSYSSAEIKEVKKEDIRIHIKDVIGSKLAAYSSSTFDELAPKQKKKKSIFKFFKKNDFCLHTADPPESDSFSVNTSGLSIFGKNQEKDTENTMSKKSIKAVSAAPVKKISTGEKEVPPRPISRIELKTASDAVKSSSAPSSGSSLVNYSQNSLLLQSNKDRRRSKIRQVTTKGNGSDNDSKQTLSSSARSSNNSSGSQPWQISNKERRRSKVKFFGTNKNK